MRNSSSPRIVAVILMFCLMFSMLPLASAGSLASVQAEVASAQGRAGDTVSVAVYMEPGQTVNTDDAFWQYSMTVNYDPNVLVLQGTGDVVDEADSALFQPDTSVTGSVYVAAQMFGVAQFISDRQPVFTMKFKIRNEAASGQTNVAIQSGTFTLNSIPAVIPSLTPGIVTIANDAPTASEVNITGAPEVGAALAGGYKYADTEGNPEGASTFQWYAADDAAGTNKTAIAGATASSLVLTAAELSKYVTFEVAPVAASGTTAGAAVSSQVLGPVVPVVHQGTVTVGTASGIPGQTVEVPVTLSTASASVGAYGVRIGFDPSALEVFSVTGESGDIFASNYSNADGWVQGVWSDVYGGDKAITAGSAMFNVVFTIKADAALGNKALTVDSGSLSSFTLVDALAYEMNKTVVPGKVSVVAPNAAPKAQSVKISGTSQTGQTLVGSFDYMDPENDPQGASTFQWYTADDAAGTNKTVIAGATTSSLLLTYAQMGKYITYEVTPVAASGTAVGLAVSSPLLGPVVPVIYTGTVTVGNASGYAGQTVEVPVMLASATAPVGAYGIRIGFDPSALEVSSVTGQSGDIFSSNYSNADGWVQAAWADALGGTNGIVSGNAMFKIKFTIKSSAGSGDKKLTVSSAAPQFTLIDKEGVEMNKTANEGKVSVISKKSQPAQPQIITVNVEDSGTKKGVVATASIERTLKSDGTKSDKVLFSTDQAKKTVESLIAAGSKSASIVIPDANDEVSEVNVTVPKDSKQLISNAKIGLGIVTDNVKVLIPNDSLTSFGDDLYFHFVPIKAETEKQQAGVRANNDSLVKKAAGKQGVTVIGRPMTIETNMQNRQVTLVMPLKGLKLSQAELDHVGVYVEHSDGTKELLQGTIVSYNGENEQGVQFNVNKFSTFTLVQMKAEYAEHIAYINGYSDGTFRPDNQITRAEIAAILSRVVGKDAKDAEQTYQDVAPQHWAHEAIAKATAMKIMSGYPDGSFAPDQSITRAEMASLVSLVIGGSSPTGSGFADISEHWGKTAILKVQGAGVMQGYDDGSFRPDQPLTRAEAVVIINRATGRRGSLDGTYKSPWNDVPGSHWASRDIAEASVNHTYDKADESSGEHWIQK